jgi:hypothetical protein
MAHYAFLDLNNIVTEVIVGQDESNTQHDWEIYYGNIRNQTCKRTSYNTSGGTHLNNGTPFRKNYAGLGYTYDYEKDAFIPEQPYASWTLNEETCNWDCPVQHPTEIEDADGNPISYNWNEEDQQWDVIS